MRWGLAAVAALVLAALGAHFLLQDRGYVLINFRGLVIEMSVPALLLGLVLLYGALRMVATLWQAPRRLGERLAGHRSKRAARRISEAMMHIAEGRLAKGERLLTGSLRSADAPLVNYLLAARTAQEQGSPERRDEWLRLAYEQLPQAQTTVLLTQAELQLANGESERALATLRRVEADQPAHPVALGLLAETLDALGDWRSVVDLLPRMSQARITAEKLELIAAGALRHWCARPELTREEFMQLWTKLPAGLRSAVALLELRAHTLARLGFADDAERELRSWLRRDWQAPLIDVYGEILSSEPREQLRRAESWLGEHPDDAALLLAAARLAIANELWGKARSYLESSIALAPRPESYALYARLLDRLGESDEAALAYRSGLGLVTGSGLPALGSDRRENLTVDKTPG
jgi:HemY protein